MLIIHIFDPLISLNIIKIIRWYITSIAATRRIVNINISSVSVGQAKLTTKTSTTTTTAPCFPLIINHQTIHLQMICHVLVTWRLATWQFLEEKCTYILGLFVLWNGHIDTSNNTTFYIALCIIGLKLP